MKGTTVLINVPTKTSLQAKTKRHLLHAGNGYYAMMSVMKDASNTIYINSR